MLQLTASATHVCSVGLCLNTWLPSALRVPACRSVILAALPPAQRWSPTTHAYFPPAFKTAARQLMLAAARQQRQAPPLLPVPAGATLAAVPQDALYHVLSLSSEPLSFWLIINNQH